MRWTSTNRTSSTRRTSPAGKHGQCIEECYRRCRRVSPHRDLVESSTNTYLRSDLPFRRKCRSTSVIGIVEGPYSTERALQTRSSAARMSARTRSLCQRHRRALEGRDCTNDTNLDRRLRQRDRPLHIARWGVDLRRRRVPINRDRARNTKLRTNPRLTPSEEAK